MSLAAGLRGVSTKDDRSGDCPPLELCWTAPKLSMPFSPPVTFAFIGVAGFRFRTVERDIVWDLGVGMEATSIFSLTLSLQSLIETGEIVVGLVRVEVKR